MGRGGGREDVGVRWGGGWFSLILGRFGCVYIGFLLFLFLYLLAAGFPPSSSYPRAGCTSNCIPTHCHPTVYFRLHPLTHDHITIYLFPLSIVISLHSSHTQFFCTILRNLTRSPIPVLRKLLGLLIRSYTCYLPFSSYHCNSLSISFCTSSISSFICHACSVHSLTLTLRPIRSRGLPVPCTIISSIGVRFLLSIVAPRF